MKNGCLLMHQMSYKKMCDTFKNIPKTKCKLSINTGIIVEKVYDLSCNVNYVPERSLIGSLLLLASRTRTDIIFYVTMLYKYCIGNYFVKLFKYVVNT